MRKKQIFYFLATATFWCCAMLMQTSCSGDDDSASTISPATPAQLKQGVWTEYDEALLTSGKYTEEQLAAMPSVGMMIEGDKGYFFTYTAEGADDLVEGKISYDNKTGKGTIAFPTITDSPISGQTVSFSMTTDETMQFEFTYDGKKTTGTCAWLCENLDNWNTEITDADWKELMAYYQSISEEAGPDASIDWSAPEVVTVQEVDDEGNIVEKTVTVTDLDEPLEWNDETAATRAGTRAIGIGTVVSVGLKVFSSLFEEDPNEKINAKLDAVLGKVDQVLANQQVMNAKLDKINGNLIAIAQKMQKKEIVDIFNNRNEKFYNKLKVQNRKYFDSAYKLYKENKNDSKLGQYAKAWVGTDEKYADLTWQYIEYLTTVEHSDYGKGMDRIYDGLTFDKWPWEHLGIGDRQDYRAYDLTMIAKCLFMISLYSTYGGLNDVEKEGLYNSYNGYKPQLKQFCEFKVSNPDKFRVCQIPGAHFVMHKGLQKYNFCGADKKRPQENHHGNNDAAYFPEWHEKGKIKIENPKELKSKLITRDEADAIFKYYAPNNEKIWWTNMIVNGNTTGGAAYAQAPSYDEPCLMLYDPQNRNNDNGLNIAGAALNELTLGPVMRRPNINWCVYMGWIETFTPQLKWSTYKNIDYYAAIVEKRY